MDLSGMHAASILVGGFFIGAGMELFMVKVWIGKTNFYEVVKRKEVERREEAVKSTPASGEVPFGELLKQQWEERKKELAAKQQSADQ